MPLPEHTLSIAGQANRPECVGLPECSLGQGTHQITQYFWIKDSCRPFLFVDLYYLRKQTAIHAKYAVLTHSRLLLQQKWSYSKSLVL